MAQQAEETVTIERPRINSSLLNYKAKIGVTPIVKL